ncbi:MAG: ParA family protein [Gammaproteobacteria bacterium]|nr:ParA family protein [Gammaproteobacteria bacterium]
MNRRSLPELAPEQRRILVVNAKGGCGKTTLTTNLAALYASMEVDTALVDHDPQGSSSQWLKARGESRPPIQGVAPWKHTADASTTRSFQMRLAFEARRVVIDTPAALSASDFGRWLREADRIVIPVLPSAIDIKAGARFIGDLLLDRHYRSKPVPLAVVANRVRRNTLVFQKLERFLISLRIPFVATFRDLQGYVRAAESGDGLFELARGGDDQEWASFVRLIRWIEAPTSPRVIG